MATKEFQYFECISVPVLGGPAYGADNEWWKYLYNEFEDIEEPPELCPICGHYPCTCEEEPEEPYVYAEGDGFVPDYPYAHGSIVKYKGGYYQFNAFPTPPIIIEPTEGANNPQWFYCGEAGPDWGVKITGYIFTANTLKAKYGWTLYDNAVDSFCGPGTLICGVDSGGSQLPGGGTISDAPGTRSLRKAFNGSVAQYVAQVGDIWLRLMGLDGGVTGWQPYIWNGVTWEKYEIPEPPEPCPICGNYPCTCEEEPEPEKLPVKGCAFSDVGAKAKYGNINSHLQISDYCEQHGWSVWRQGIAGYALKLPPDGIFINSVHFGHGFYAYDPETKLLSILPWPESLISQEGDIWLKLNDSTFEWEGFVWTDAAWVYDPEIEAPSDL